MNRFDPEEETDRRDLARLNVEPWMAEQLRLNPRYTGWGPGMDYMKSSGSGEEHGYDRGAETSWADFQLQLDDYNECVHFYFELDRKSKECPSCPDSRGLSPEAFAFDAQWYGKAPFDAAAYGAIPLALDDPALRAAARRACERTEGRGVLPYGEDGIAREARRIHGILSRCWSHQLIQADVDALVAAGRHTLWGGIRTVDEVNSWSMDGFGHDAINNGVCVEARCKREGVPYMCAACEGHGYVFDAPAGHLNLVLWILHPRKGASCGWRVTHIPQVGLTEIYRFLGIAAQRSRDRFAFVERFVAGGAA